MRGTASRLVCVVGLLLGGGSALAQSQNPGSSSAPTQPSLPLTIVKPDPPQPEPGRVDASGNPIPDPWTDERRTDGFAPLGDNRGAPSLSSPGVVTPSALPATPQPLPTSVQDPDTVVAGEILTLSNSMPEAIALAGTLASRGLTVIRRQALGSFGDIVLSAFRLPAGRDVPGMLDELRQAYPQLWVGPNSLFDPSAGTEQKPRTYAREVIGWSVVTADCGAGIRIGVVDTGVDLKHPALEGRGVVARSFLPAGTTPAPKTHGTAVTSILVGDGDASGFPSLLPGARILMAEVFHASEGNRVRATAERIVLGLNWLLGEGLRVVNLSLGGPVDPILSLIIDRAAASGMILVAAAGNNGPNAPPAFPAVHKAVVAVTAVDAARKVFAQANRGDYIDFAAPGVDLWLAWSNGGGSYQTGTSYAAPFVAAALALGAGQAIPLLQETAEDLGPPGRDPVYGWGLMTGRACGATGAAAR